MANAPCAPAPQALSTRGLETAPPAATYGGTSLSGRVGLVIPAWNEEKAIAAVLAEVPAGSVDSVFVVIRSEQDPTGHLAADLGARLLVQTRPGYGAACWEGALAAIDYGADVVAFMDGDYSDPPEFLPLVLEPILRGDADFSLGCRDLSHFPLAQPPHARLGNALVLAGLTVLLRRRIRDLPSLKAIRAGSLRQLDLQEMTYGFTVEMIVKSVRIGLRIAQVPVPYRPRLGGRSKISGSARGTVGAAWKLCTCPLRYALWRPEVATLPRAEGAV